MEIHERQTLEMRNVLSYRSRMTQQQLQIKAQEIEAIISTAGTTRDGHTVTTTFSIEPQATGTILDTEILVPLDREIVAPEGYKFKPHFLLTNAVMIKHIGHPSGLQQTIDELNTYIADRRLVPITSGYNVTVKEIKSISEIDKMEIDIYVGISPNIL